MRLGETKEPLSGADQLVVMATAQANDNTKPQQQLLQQPVSFYIARLQLATDEI